MRPMKKTIKIEFADNGMVVRDEYYIGVAEYGGVNKDETDPAALEIGKSIVSTLFDNDDFLEEEDVVKNKTGKPIIGCEITMYIKPLTKI